MDVRTSAFFRFRPEIPFLRKFAQKKKKVCQCKLKFGTKTNSNMLNCDVHFFCFSLEISFLGKLGPKTQNRQIKVKFGS